MYYIVCIYIMYIAFTLNLKRMEKESKLVSMNLSSSTVQHIENIKELTQESNRTRIIATSVKLADEILKNVKKGAKVYIEKEDGTKELINFIGI